MKMNALPDGWKFSKIGDLCSPISTAALNQRSSDSFLYVDISSIDNELKRITSAARILPGEAPSRARQIMATEDVLVSTVRPGLNAVSLVPPYLNGEICSTGFCVLRAKASVLLPEFLFAWVRHPIFIQNLVRQERGIGYPSISNREVESSQIPLPPLPEQRQIVSVLREAIELLWLRREADGVIAQLHEKLFYEMFGDPLSSVKKWGTSRLEALFEKKRAGIRTGPFGSSLKKHEYTKSGIPVWGINNIQKSRFVENDSLFISSEKYQQLTEYTVENGDVLISRAGTTGKVCVVRTSQHPSIIGTNLIRISLDQSKIVPEYFASLLPILMKQMSELRASGGDAAYSFLNPKNFQSLSIALPPYSLQKSFVACLEKTNEIADHFATTKYSLSVLSKSLLAHAFSGELTADWRKKHKTALSTAAKKRDQELQRAALTLTPTTSAVASESVRSLPSQAASEGAAEKTTSPNPVLLPFDPPAVEGSINVSSSDLLPVETVAQPVGWLANLSAVQQKVWAAAQVMKGRFTAESLRESVQSLASDSDINAVMVRRGLEVLAAAGLLLPVSLAAQTPEADEFFFTAYRALRPEDDGRADRNALEMETA